MKLRINLTNVPRCSKAGCTHRALMHRHHTSHQWMWVRAFAIRRSKEKKYRSFVKAYGRFNQKDIVLLCPGHHGEIHELYDDIITRAIYSHHVPLECFSWRQANRLMSSLRSRYLKWKDIETNISNPPTERLEPWGDI